MTHLCIYFLLLYTYISVNIVIQQYRILQSIITLFTTISSRSKNNLSTENVSWVSAISQTTLLPADSFPGYENARDRKIKLWCLLSLYRIRTPKAGREFESQSRFSPHQRIKKPTFHVGEILTDLILKHLGIVSGRSLLMVRKAKDKENKQM